MTSIQRTLVNLLTWFGVVSVVLLWSAGDNAFAEERLGELPLSDEMVSLLGGRLQAQLPKGANVWSQEYVEHASFLGTPERAGADVKSGKAEMFLELKEMFQVSGGDFESEVRRQLARFDPAGKGELSIEAFPGHEGASPNAGFCVIRARLGEPMPRYGEAPSALGPRDYATGSVAYVRLPDRSVLQMEFVWNSPALADREGCDRLSRGILSSLRPGSAPLRLLPRSQRLPIPSKEYELRVELPPNVAATIDRGPDFVVYLLTAVSPFAEVGNGIGIYYGNHPNWHHNQRWGRPAVKVSSADGSLLGRQEGGMA